MSDWRIRIEDWAGQKHYFDIEGGFSYTKKANDVGELSWSIPTHLSGKIQDGYDVYVEWRGHDVWGGKIKNRNRNQLMTDFSAEDWWGAFARREITHRFYASTEISSIINTLVTNYLDDFTLDLDTTNTSVKWGAEKQTLGKIINDLAMIAADQDGYVGYVAGINPDKEVFFRRRGYQKFNGSLPQKAFVEQESSADIINSVSVHGRPAFPFPQDGDAWTENSSNLWQVTWGGAIADSYLSVKGVASLRIGGDPSPNSRIKFRMRMHPTGASSVDFSNANEFEIAVAGSAGVMANIDYLTITYWRGGIQYTRYILLDPAVAEVYRMNRRLFSSFDSSNGGGDWHNVTEIEIEIFGFAAWATNDYFYFDSFHLKFPEIFGTASDAASIKQYWRADKSFSYPDIWDQTTIQILANNLLARLKERSISYQGSVVGFVPIELGEYYHFDHIDRPLDLACSEINVIVSADGSTITNLVFGVPPLAMEELITRAIIEQPWHKNRQGNPPLGSAGNMEIRDSFQGIPRGYGVGAGPCVGDCQVSCQSVCQTVCQSACEADSCQNMCETTSCETDCQDAELRRSVCRTECQSSIIGGPIIT